MKPLTKTAKPKAAPRPRLNKGGIEKLKADLRANARHYNQHEFAAQTDDCGTEVCMAGMCLYKLVGEPLFLTMLKEGICRFSTACLNTAYLQLGIVPLSELEYERISGQTIAPIFNRSRFWPEDLKKKYNQAFDNHNHVDMVEAACEALDRIDVHGCFKGMKPYDRD